MSAELLNILIGLVTTVISGASVWLWERGRQARSQHRKARFFGLENGTSCVVVMNDKYSMPGSTAHDDVYALVEIAMLARNMDSEVSIRPARELVEGVGGRTEFCIGGPIADSNPRTGAHLAMYLPGVKIVPFSTDTESMAFVVGKDRFRCERSHRERALVAKFRPITGSQPVFVVCGHTALANRAAVHFLTNRYQELARAVESEERFCVVILVDAIEAYGHEAASVERDVTRSAFVAAS